MGLKANRAKKWRRALWTITELETLRQTVDEQMDISKSAALFPQRTHQAVSRMRALLRKERGESKPGSRPWTTDETEELLAFAAQVYRAKISLQSSNQLSWETIAEKLGRTVASVENRLKRLRMEERLKKGVSRNALGANKASISDSDPSQ